MRKLICLLIVVELMLVVTPKISYGYKGDKDAVQFQAAMPKMEIESEYLAPVAEDRQIDTVSLDLLFGNESSHSPIWLIIKDLLSPMPGERLLEWVLNTKIRLLGLDRFICCVINYFNGNGHYFHWT